ncbi:hypothetical protein EDEG_01102 [Edhazardia aedis USNM 41457]|uniref:Calponin-homology (CH) domain-containing protein n=1 Tax=Edhazardia aedis (strain USNM 41457) TaxID=1003232 RepID=J9DB18_EDHAE|nr:hypothetical protein EDEG_01102 [Edhazardia aedis USNM 41457]|eukprot:EJW04689.1 hypothetical protein EDEG_01102 [Edhazardia aedis USNM 41457]
MRNEANYNNSAFNRNNQDVKDKINLKSTVTLECGKKNNIYSDNLNNNRENNYSNNVKYSENINSPKFGQNQQTISLIKNSSANPNIEINKIYFEKYKDKIRRSHRGFSIIDENTVNNGLKKAIQNVSTDGEYRNYIEAEAKAYSTYIKSVLPSDINLNTSIPIFPQLENGLILAYFLNSIKKNTIDLSKIVILKKDDMNYLWETTNNLNYIIRACKNLGLKTINIGSNDIQNRKQTLVLGLLWQMIKFDLTKDNNLFSRPELVDLKKEGECVSEFGRISCEELCLRWINYHLKLAKKKDFFAKFEENSPVDILDSLEDDKISTKSKIKLIKSSKNDEYKKDLYKKFIAASSSVSKFNKSIGKTKTFITNSEVDNLDEVDVNSNEDEIKAPKYYQSYIRKTETPQNNSHADLSTQTNFYNSESFVKNVEFNEKLPRDNIYNVPIRCRNLNNDLKDSKIYLILLKHLADSEISDEEIMSAWLETNLEKRAERVIFLANKIDCKSFISPHDIIHGDLKLNFLFVQNLMNKRSGLPNTKANIKMLHKKLQSAEDNLKLCQSKIQNLSSEIEQTSSEKISCIEENKNLKKNMTNLAIQYEKHIRDLENNVKLFVYQIENQIQDEVKINLFNDKVKLGNLFNKEKESDLQQQRLKSIQNGYIDNLKFESNSINESKEQISSIVSRLNTEIKLLVTEKNQALKIIEDKNVMDKQMDDQINQYLEYMKKNHKKKSKNVFRFLGCNK